MLERAGLAGYKAQYKVDLGGRSHTVPDFYHDSPSDSYEGLCIYMDGMSKTLHGDPARRQRDRQTREELRNRSYEVVEITYTQLFDRDAMRQHFFRIGRFLLGKERAQQLRQDTGWFTDNGSTAAGS
jgi:hypothetical protein